MNKLKIVDLLKKQLDTFQHWLDNKFTKRQQTLGVLVSLVVLLIVCIILVFTNNVPFTNSEKEDGEKIKTPTVGMTVDDVPEDKFAQVNVEDGVGKANSDDLVLEEEGKFETTLENAVEITVPEIPETNAEVIDSSENYILFLGHAGVLSLYDKREKTFIQLDNIVMKASISDDEKFVAYTMDGLLESELRVYNVEKKLVEQILRKENAYFSDVAMHDGTISFIFHEQNTESYQLETFAHFDYREGRLPNTLARQKESNVGPYLHHNQEGVYYYHQATEEIKRITPGKKHAVIGKLKVEHPEMFVVSGDNFAIIDNGTLVTKSSRYEKIDTVSSLTYLDGVIHYTKEGNLYNLIDGKENLLSTDAKIVSVNQQDMVVQGLSEKVFLQTKNR